MRGINGDNICECVYEKEKGGQRGGEKGEGEKEREGLIIIELFSKLLK